MQIPRPVDAIALQKLVSPSRYVQYGSVLLLLVAIALFVATLINPHNLFVQVDYAIELVQTVRNGTEFRPLSDLLNTIATMAIVEQRSRLLPYYLIALDQKLRLALYAFGAVPPSFNPVRWLLDGIVGPVLLFGFVRMMTKSAAAACVGLAIYMSSPSFMNIFTMNWVPTKALENVAFITMLWLGARMDRRLQPQQLLFEGAYTANFALAVAILAGVLCDEYGILGPVLIVLMFWWRFLPQPFERRTIAQAMKNIAWFLYPVSAFVAIMAIIIPLVSWYAFGIRYAYFETTLASGFQTIHAVLLGPTESGRAAVNWDILFGPVLNVVNFFGISLLPYALTGLAPQFFIHLGIQELGWLHVVAFAALATLVAASISKAGSESLFYRLLPALVTTVVLMLLISVIAIAGDPRAPNGYYYGAPVAVPFSIFLAYLFRYSAGTAKALVLIGAFWVVFAQHQNFLRLNEIWAQSFDIFNSRSLAKYLPFRAPEHKPDGDKYEDDFKVSSFGTLPGPGARFPTWDVRIYDEMREVLQASAAGGLDAYLDRRALAPRLFYLVPEQCVLNPRVSRRCGPLVAALSRQLTE
jgi:hypothetical protein